MEVEGFLNINKPDGITSAEVVRIIKRNLKVKKIGYIGTLDPIARGVLVVAMGRATRFVHFLEKHSKEYEAIMSLGSETDTQDRTGKILNEADPSSVTEAEIIKVMSSYKGQTLQVPPMYSAKKIDGKRLYVLARQGLSVKREALPINVSEIKFISKSSSEVRFIAKVSAGAYLRTLCHDMGLTLGVYAHLKCLTRLRAGNFHLIKSIELDSLSSSEGLDAQDGFLSISEGLSHMSKAIVISHAEERVINGMPIGVSDILKYQDNNGELLTRIHDKNGRFFGVGMAEGPPLAGFPFGSIKPKRVLT